jgi:hypothetical protein
LRRDKLESNGIDLSSSYQHSYVGSLRLSFAAFWLSQIELGHWDYQLLQDCDSSSLTWARN